MFNNEKNKNENNSNNNLSNFEIIDDINSHNFDLNINETGKDENMFNLNIMKNLDFEKDDDSDFWNWWKC